MAALASGASVLLALAVASAGVVSAAGAILILALALGLYARNWLSLAEPSRVGARAEDEVWRVLGPLRVRAGGCATRCRGGDVHRSRPGVQRWKAACSRSRSIG
jgi:hypothetical protein